MSALKDDTRFWRRVEKIAEDWNGIGDDAVFRRRMRRKGFDAEVIEGRLADLKASKP